MQSTAGDVDTYLSEVPTERVEAMQRLRGLCQEHLTGWTERMQWGMPGYGPPDGDALVSFNSQKNYISIYPGRAALEEHRSSLKNCTFGGGCVRFAKPEKIDFGAVTAMLKHVRANKG